MITVAEAMELLRIVQEIDLCDRTIAQYAEAGISGTPHDVEHRRMREDAMKRFEELRR
jgi:hypothetical protein